MQIDCMPLMIYIEAVFKIFFLVNFFFIIIIINNLEIVQICIDYLKSFFFEV